MSVPNYHILLVVHVVVESCGMLLFYFLSSQWHISCRILETRHLQLFHMQSSTLSRKWSLGTSEIAVYQLCSIYSSLQRIPLTYPSSCWSWTFLVLVPARTGKKIPAWSQTHSLILLLLILDQLYIFMGKWGNSAI